MKTTQDRIDAIERELAELCSTHGYSLADSWEANISALDIGMADEAVRFIAPRINIRLIALVDLRRQLAQESQAPASVASKP